MTCKGIPVLMYHALEDDLRPAGAKDQGEQLYVISVDAFYKQMRYLHSNGFRSLLFDELSGLDVWPEKGIVITFDDGHESNYTLALPILQEFGFTAEFYITTGWLDTEKYLKQSQVTALHQAGMSIGSHSVTHSYLNNLSTDEVFAELDASRKDLSRLVGHDIHGFSAPGGRITQSTIKMARKCGYSFLCKSDPKAFFQDSDLLAIPRFAIRNSTSIDRFVDIVTLNKSMLCKIRLKAVLLDYLKRILGNRLYEKIREMFI